MNITIIKTRESCVPQNSCNSLFATMKPVPHVLFVFAIGIVQIFGACNLGFGKTPPTGVQLHILHARSGPESVPRNMSLVFDYQVSPVENVNITYVNVTTSLTNGCTFSHPANGDITKGFKITVNTHEPVLELSGTAIVYGLRYGNW